MGQTFSNNLPEFALMPNQQIPMIQQVLPSLQPQPLFNQAPQLQYQPSTQLSTPGLQIVQQPMLGSKQPTSVGWSTNSNFHDHLLNTTGFYVEQQIELIEIFLNWETSNRYTVKNQFGQRIFFVGETSNCCGRQCCGQFRGFTLTIKDTLGNTILVFDRAINCSCCCGLFCKDAVTARTQAGELLGKVEERFSCCKPRFKIYDAVGNPILNIDGPCCPISCGGPVVFQLTDLDGNPCGQITKEWSGLVREVFTDADTFSVTFPTNLSTSIKATCLAALFLIDFEFFESNRRDNNLAYAGCLASALTNR